MKNTIRAKPIPKTQLEILIENVGNPRDKALIILLYLTGARVSEILALKKEDITVDESERLLVAKLPTLKRKSGVLDRNVAIKREDKYAQWLEKYLETLEPNQPVIYNQHIPNEPIDRQHAWRIIKKYCREIWPHLFRHTRLTELAKRFTEFQLMKFAGWTDTRPAKNYIHLTYQDYADKL